MRSFRDLLDRKGSCSRVIRVGSNTKSTVSEERQNVRTVREGIRALQCKQQGRRTSGKKGQGRTE